jgi:hypothetical protein
VDPMRGVMKFHPIDEGCLAVGGKTIASLTEQMELELEAQNPKSKEAQRRKSRLGSSAGIQNPPAPRKQSAGSQQSIPKQPLPGRDRAQSASGKVEGLSRGYENAPESHPPMPDDLSLLLKEKSNQKAKIKSRKSIMNIFSR